MTINSLALALLGSHVIAGVVALFAGFVAILTPKGGPRHNRAGRWYVVAMAFVVTSAIPLAIRIESWFLLAIAVFSGYLVFAGYRVIWCRRAGLDGPTPIDWIGHGSMVLVGAAMLVAGTVQSTSGEPGLGPVLAGFGAIGVVLAGRTLRQFRLPRESQLAWWESHITLMGGAYIATVTAAVTVNLQMVPPLVRWLAPTILGVPLIVYGVRVYGRRFGRSHRSDSVAG